MENFKNKTSERGKDLVLLNNDKYSYVRTRKDGLMKWRGSKYSCGASLLTKIDNIFHSSNGEHVNHVVITTNKLKDRF